MFTHTPLDYVALGLIVFAFCMTVSVFLVAHEIPYIVAKKKNHRNTDAIHWACWLSIFTGGMLWPLTLLWSLCAPGTVLLHQNTNTEEV